MKYCPKCETEKDESEFYDRKRKLRDGSRHIVKHPYCKQCQNMIKGNRRLIKFYGIDYEEYFKILKSQNRVCAGCGNKDDTGRNLAVDHCHETNKVRGLLCVKCNRALGLLKDNPKTIANLFKYLTKEEL